MKEAVLFKSAFVVAFYNAFSMSGLQLQAAGDCSRHALELASVQFAQATVLQTLKYSKLIEEEKVP